MKKLLTTTLVLGALVLGACNSAADVASQNLSQAADQFEIDRRVVFFNGITDTYLLSIEGRCSIEADELDRQLEVTCKTGEDAYKKHFLGLSDNVSYFVEQMESVDVSEFHYRVFFRPQQIVPNIDVEAGS
jgi:predicted small secreted protein